jgi:hypothetical protein
MQKVDWVDWMKNRAGGTGPGEVEPLKFWRRSAGAESGMGQPARERSWWCFQRQQQVM